MVMSMLRVAAALAIATLAGCASLNAIDSEVTAYSRWPADRTPATYAFERLPSQQAHAQEALALEDAARHAVEAAGFKPAAEGAAPDVVVQIGARITAYDRSPFDDPFWYGAYGPFHAPFAYGRYGRPYWGPGWRPGIWGPGYDFPYYEREVAVLIRDKRSGEPLYETRANSDGTTSGATLVLPAMFTAALQGFPKAASAQPHRVRVALVP